MTFLRRYGLLILLAATATALVIFRIWADRQPPQVIKVDPSPGTLEQSPTQLKLSFSRNVSGAKTMLTLKVNPEIPLSLAWQKDRLTIILSQPLAAGTKYDFGVYFQDRPIYSWNYEMAEKKMEYKPAGGIGDPGIREDMLKDTQKDFPLLYFLPYNGTDFSIDYIGPLKLKVVVKKGSSSDVKWEVYDWLRERGVEPDSHQIVWEEK